MQWAAWDARLSKTDDSGVLARAHYEFAASKGNAKAIRALTPPCEYPEVLDYLWTERFQVLNGMRHYGEMGPLPFTPEMILAANALFGWELSEREALALHALDLTVRNPETLAEKADEPKAQAVPERNWPSNKREGA